jgi:hypothetical protein
MTMRAAAGVEVVASDPLPGKEQELLLHGSVCLQPHEPTLCRHGLHVHEPALASMRAACATIVTLRAAGGGARLCSG